MIEQIIVRNDYEQEALELLKRQNFDHAKRFETRFLMKTGLNQDMNQAFTVPPSDGRILPMSLNQVRIS